MVDVATNIKINAIVDLESGETLLAHPTKDDVYVTAKHFAKLASGAAEDTNCTYTSRQVCSSQIPSPSSYTGYICTGWTTIQTCNCDD